MTGAWVGNEAVPQDSLVGTWVPPGLCLFPNSLPGLGPVTQPGGCGPCPLWPAAQALKEAEGEGRRLTTGPSAVKHWLGSLGKSWWQKDGEEGLEPG